MVVGTSISTSVRTPDHQQERGGERTRGQRMDDEDILAVLPASKAHLQALLHGDGTFERESGMRVAADLIGFDGMLEHDDDVGKIIGRHGRTVNALRTVMRACATRQGRRVLVDVVD